MEEGAAPVIVALVTGFVVWMAVRLWLRLAFRRAARSLGLSPYGTGVSSFTESMDMPLFGSALFKRHAYVSPAQEGFYVVYQNIAGPMSRAVSVYQCPFSGPSMGAVVGELRGGVPLPQPFEGKLHGGMHLFGGPTRILSALATDTLLQKWVSSQNLSFQVQDGVLYVFSPGNFAFGTRIVPFAESARYLAQHLNEKYGHNPSLQGRRP